VIVSLKSAAFRAEREGTWRELEALLATVEKGGVRRLSPRQLLRLPVLYRATLSALSVARAISLDQNLLGYLESLSSRAYLVVYGVRKGLGAALADFFVRRFPRAVRAHLPQIALATALLVAGAATGLALTLRDPDRFYAFVDPAYAQGRGPGSSAESLRKVLYSGTEGEGGTLQAFAMFLFSHNAGIGLLAFALGVAGGVVSAWLLFSNGLVLGAFAALYARHGLSLELWAWLLPHGVVELSGVVLCGGVGLALGQALVFPGQEERLAALSRRGREAAVVALGCVALFFVAGIFEGVFRQRVHDPTVRYAVALLNALLLLAYLALSGREEPGLARRRGEGEARAMGEEPGLARRRGEGEARAMGEPARPGAPP
jgi:uncharacterized membrane protein SpoIIM required for sporulation